MEFFAKTLSLCSEYAKGSFERQLCDQLGDGFVGFILGLSIVSLVVCVFTIIAMWKIFKKAGYAGWKSIIPFYNMYIYTEISGYNGWMFLLCLIPFVGTIIWAIMTSLGIAKNFGKGTGFAIGLILLSTIFELILGFGSAQYKGANASSSSSKSGSAKKDSWVEGK